MESTDLKLVLASGSPRRRELLESLGLIFQVRPADVDESIAPGESPETYVTRLALTKAIHQVAPGEIVIAADTTVVLDGEILGKPTDTLDARHMLERLQGREHTVFTGVAVHVAEGATGQSGRSCQGISRTSVRIAPMSDQELDWYSRSGEPDDKAGSYAIQGLGALFVEEIGGNYTNVVGLPLPLVKGLLREVGVDLASRCRAV